MGIDKRKYKKIPARMISLTAMFAAFTAVCLYLSYVVPNMKFTFYFLSSIFVMGILIEGMSGMAVLLYVIVSGLSLIILPIYYALPYIILFGHYGLGKYFLETRFKNKVLATVLKLIYFNIALAGMYFAVIYTGFLPMNDLFEKLPIWSWALIIQPVFLVFDFIYSKVTVFYVGAIRSRVIR